MVLIGFSVVGIVLFGVESANYVDFRTTFNYLLIAVVSTQGLAYNEIAEIDDVYAPFFWYAFTLILFVLVMNMVLAIVFSTYDALREEEDSKEQIGIHDLLREIWGSIRGSPMKELEEAALGDTMLSRDTNFNSRTNLHADECRAAEAAVPMSQLETELQRQEAGDLPRFRPASQNVVLFGNR